MLMHFTGGKPLLFLKAETSVSSFTCYYIKSTLEECIATRRCVDKYYLYCRDMSLMDAEAYFMRCIVSSLKVWCVCIYGI